MKAAAMDPERLAELRPAVARAPGFCLNTRSEHVRELLADRDHQAARVAAVIAVMRRMDDDRAKLLSARNESIGIARGVCHGKVAARTFVLEELRVALGLPSEWRDTCPMCGSGEGVCELWCDLEDGGEG